MREFETTFITIEEYRDLEDSRLSEADLAINGIYTAMVKLEPYSGKLQAAEFPLRLHQLFHTEGPFYNATVAPLDADFREAHMALALFSKGYWRNVRQEIEFRSPTGHNVKPEVAYLRPFVTQEDEELTRLNQELLLTA